MAYRSSGESSAISCHISIIHAFIIDLGLTSWLPVEVYHIFLTFSLPEHLPSIALVSRTFAAEAQRVLFKDIRIASMPKLIQLLRILASRPVLAAYVRVLVISCGIIEPELLRAFYTLLSRALNQTRNLAMLDLPFFSPHSKFLLGSSVRLDEFRTGMDWDADFSRWLAEQDKLRFLNFYGVRCGPWELSEDALRDLCFIGGPPSVLKRVIPGRPITAVHVRVSGPFQLEADSLSQVAEAIASSSATVTYASVQVQYNGVRSEEDFMLDRHTVVAAFNALASALSSVTTLFFMPGRIFVDQVSHLQCTLMHFYTVYATGPTISDGRLHGTSTVSATVRGACASRT